MAASVTVPKADPADSGAIAIDGIEHDLDEILVGEMSRQVQATLAGGLKYRVQQVGFLEPGTQATSPSRRH